MCFEPTYEELKHSKAPERLKLLFRFEPTYEELKPHSRRLTFCYRKWFWAYLWGIETKCIVAGTSGSSEVLSLPMRNWNILSMQCSVNFLKVLSLPMRNWNSGLQSFWMAGKYVLSLPMRNWNHHHLTVFLGDNCVLSLPMRNWNLA